MENAANQLFKRTRQAIWFDGIDRNILENDFQNWQTRLGVRGITTNPIIFRDAVLGDSSYQTRVAELHRDGMDAKEIAAEIAFQDCELAARMFLGRYQHTEGMQGFISIEVDPELAHDADGTIAEARVLAARFAELGLPNYMIKIPATEAGLKAMEVLFEQGINVNATLVFGVRTARQIARLHKELNGPACVISFFVSRWDAKVDPLLKSPYTPARGQTGIALAKQVYMSVNNVYSRGRINLSFQPARVLFASTSAKNPEYDPLMYVKGLIGADTINTVPPSTLEMFAESDAGILQSTLIQNLGHVDRVFEALKEAGVAIKKIEAELVDEGLAGFVEAQRQLVQTIDESLH